MAKTFAALVIALAVGSASAAGVSGTVLGPEGHPIEGARVCYLEGRVEQRCAQTDAQGYFALSPSQLTRVRVVVTDFMPQTFEAARVPSPIVLQRAPSLFVRLVDASSGQPIPSGQVFVIYPSGARKGPFPANAVGVRIQRVLDPGQVLLLGEADGFTQAEPKSVALEGGRHTEAVLELQPASGRDHP